VADVAADGERKVTTDSTFLCSTGSCLAPARGDRPENIARTGGRSEWVGGAKHHTARLDSVETLPDHGDDGARSHILDQTREERFILQILVVYGIFFSKKGAVSLRSHEDR
jgi:hypothetical protein